MTRRRGKEFHAAVYRAALRIGGAVIEAADAGESEGAGAHRAGLERDIDVAAFEPFGAEERRRLADSDNLGMRGRVAILDGAVAGARDDLGAADNDAAD